MTKLQSSYNASAGFTLIELIVVIVILGVLAGVAVPRFISQTSNARLAALKGFAGNLAGAVALAQQQYIAEGNGTTSTVSGIFMNGRSVMVVPGTGAPDASFLGSTLIAGSGPLQSWAGFSMSAMDASRTVTINFSPTPISNCYVTYNDGAAGGTGQPRVLIMTTGC